MKRTAKKTAQDSQFWCNMELRQTWCNGSTTSHPPHQLSFLPEQDTMSGLETPEETDSVKLTNLLTQRRKLSGISLGKSKVSMIPQLWLTTSNRRQKLTKSTMSVILKEQPPFWLVLLWNHSISPQILTMLSYWLQLLLSEEPTTIKWNSGLSMDLELSKLFLSLQDSSTLSHTVLTKVSVKCLMEKFVILSQVFSLT